MVAPLGIGFKMGIQKIGEKEDFQNHKHHKKLDHNDQPGLFAPGGHVGKAFPVKQEYFFY
jgi:hypothetical protein